MPEKPPKDRIVLTDEHPTITVSPGGAPIAENPPRTPVAQEETDIEAPEAPTRKETKAEMAARVAELEGLRTAEREARNEFREKRASEFAERYGLSAEREAILAAEAAYGEAAKNYEKKWLKVPERLKGRRSYIPKDVQDAYDSARLKWKNALLRVESDLENKMLNYRKPLEPMLPMYDASKEEIEAYKAKRKAYLDSPEYTQWRDATRPFSEDKILAKTIGKRDTVLREENLWIQARKESLDERGKTAYGKLLNFAKGGAKSVLNTLNAASEKGGKGIAKLAGVEENEKAVKVLTRASRIFGGAVVASAIVSAVPFGAVAATTSFGTLLAIRVARGTFGVATGMAAGYASGGLYKKLFGNRRREDWYSDIKGREDRNALTPGTRGTARLMNGSTSSVEIIGQVDDIEKGRFIRIRHTDASGKVREEYVPEYAFRDSFVPEYTLEDLEKAEKIQEKGSRKARTEAQRKAELYGSIIGGAGGSIASAPAFNHLFAHVPPVQDAADTLNQVRTGGGGGGAALETPPPGPSIPTPPIPDQLPTPGHGPQMPVPPVPDQLPSPGPGGAIPTPQVPDHLPSPAPEAAATAHPEGTPGLIDERGEGTDRAFRELQNHMRSTPNQSAVLQHFMNSNVNAISHEVGDAYGRIGMMTHEGDRFYFDERQNLYYQPNGGEAQIFLENDPSHPGAVIRHDLHPPHEHAAARPSARTETGRQAPEPAARPESTNAPASAADPVTAPAARPAPNAGTDSTRPATLGRPLGGSETMTIADTPAPRAQTGNPPTLGRLLGEQGNASEPVAPAAPNVIPTETGRTGTLGRSLGEPVERDVVGGSGSGGGGGGAEASPLSWTPEQGLPQQPAVFSVNPDSKLVIPNLRGDIFYAHASSPEASLALAQEYGRMHPGTNVVFDNSRFDMFGVKTGQVGSIRFGDNGLPQDFTAMVLDRSGDPLRSVDVDQLNSRIA